METLDDGIERPFVLPGAPKHWSLPKNYEIGARIYCKALGLDPEQAVIYDYVNPADIAHPRTRPRWQSVAIELEERDKKSCAYSLAWSAMDEDQKQRLAAPKFDA